MVESSGYPYQVIGAIRGLRESISYPNLRRAGLCDLEHTTKTESICNVSYHLRKMLSEYILAVTYAGFMNKLSKKDIKDILISNMETFLSELGTDLSLRGGAVDEAISTHIKLFESEWRTDVLSSMDDGDKSTIDSLVTVVKSIVVTAETSPYVLLRMPECTTFGSRDFRGSAAGEFNNPCGIAVDSEGNIYVADMNNNRIQKFDKDGKFILSFGSRGSATGEFNNPCGITIDSEDNIYVADYNDRIQKFDKDGNFITSFGSCGFAVGQFSAPCGITIDLEDNIYVADTYNNRIQKFDKDGNFLLSFGSRGSAAGEFNNPRGIVVDSEGDIYVVDTHNDRIQKFAKDGKFILSFGSCGFAEDWFNFPHGITIDFEDNIYVADTYNNRIQKFAKDGKFILLFGSYSSESQFILPHGITIDFEDNIYVADTGNNRIQIIKPKPIETLISCLASANPTERLVAAEILGERGDSAAIEPLINLIAAESGDTLESSLDPASLAIVKAAAEALDSIAQQDTANGLCLTPDSLIYLADGNRKQLIDIKEGDVVLSLNKETDRFESHRVVGLLNMGTKPVYRMTTESGKTLKTTANHPYLVKVEGGRWKVEEKAVAFSTFDLRPSTSKWLKLRDLKAGDEIACLADPLCGEAADGQVVTGELLGPCSNSVILDNKESSTDLMFIEFCKKIKYTFDNVFFGHIFNIDNYHTRGMFNVKSQNIPKIFVKSEQDEVIPKSVTEDILVTGASEINLKGGNKIEPHIPKSLYEIPVDTLVSKDSHKDSLRIGNCLGRMFHKFRSIFDSGNNILFGDIGILTGNIFQKISAGNKIKNITYSNTSSFNTGFAKSYFGTNRDSFFMHNSPPCLLKNTTPPDASQDVTPKAEENEAQMENGEEAEKLEAESWRLEAKASNIQPLTFSSNVVWDKIASIKYAGDLPVYDIEVEGTHNFVAEGIVAHNTYVNGEHGSAFLETFGIYDVSQVTLDRISQSLENGMEESRPRELTLSSGIILRSTDHPSYANLSVNDKSTVMTSVTIHGIEHVAESGAVMELNTALPALQIDENITITGDSGNPVTYTSRIEALMGLLRPATFGGEARNDEAYKMFILREGLAQMAELEFLEDLHRSRHLNVGYGSDDDIYYDTTYTEAQHQKLLNLYIIFNMTEQPYTITHADGTSKTITIRVSNIPEVQALFDKLWAVTRNNNLLIKSGVLPAIASNDFDELSNLKKYINPKEWPKEDALSILKRLNNKFSASLSLTDNKTGEIKNYAVIALLITGNYYICLRDGDGHFAPVAQADFDDKGNCTLEHIDVKKVKFYVTINGLTGRGQGELSGLKDFSDQGLGQLIFNALVDAIPFKRKLTIKNIVNAESLVSAAVFAFKNWRTLSVNDVPIKDMALEGLAGAYYHLITRYSSEEDIPFENRIIWRRIIEGAGLTSDDMRGIESCLPMEGSPEQLTNEQLIILHDAITSAYTKASDIEQGALLKNIKEGLKCGPYFSMLNKTEAFEGTDTAITIKLGAFDNLFDMYYEICLTATKIFESDPPSYDENIFDTAVTWGTAGENLITVFNNTDEYADNDGSIYSKGWVRLEFSPQDVGIVIAAEIEMSDRTTDVDLINNTKTITLTDAATGKEEQITGTMADCWQKYKTYEEFIDEYQKLHPDKEVIGVLPNGNVTNNNYFVAYTNGRVIASSDEFTRMQNDPERVYNSMVVYKTGVVAIEDVKFISVDRAHLTAGIIRLSDNKDITASVGSLTSGIKLVSEDAKGEGQVVDWADDTIAEDLAEKCSTDISCLLDMPIIYESIEGGAFKLFGKRQLTLDTTGKVKDAIKGRQITLDMNYQGDSIEKDALIKALERQKYAQKSNGQDVREQGDYFINGTALTIILKFSKNPYTLVGTTKEGKVISVFFCGKSREYGVTLKEAAEEMKRAGAVNAIFICGGGDVAVRMFGEEIAASHHSRDALASFILLTRQRAVEEYWDNPFEPVRQPVTDKRDYAYQLSHDVKTALENAMKGMDDIAPLLPSDLHLIIFGSRADNEQTFASDLDLVFILGGSLTRSQVIALAVAKGRMLTELQNKYPDIEINFFDELLGKFNSVENMVWLYSGNGGLLWGGNHLRTQKCIIDITLDQEPVRYPIISAIRCPTTYKINECLRIIEEGGYGEAPAIVKLEELADEEEIFSEIGQLFNAEAIMTSQAVIEKIQHSLDIDTFGSTAAGYLIPANALTIGSLILISKDLNFGEQQAAFCHEAEHLAFKKIYSDPATRALIDFTADALSDGVISALQQACKARNKYAWEDMLNYKIFILNEALAQIAELEYFEERHTDDGESIITPEQQALLTILRDNFSMTEQNVILLNADGTPLPMLDENGVQIFDEDENPVYVTVTCRYADTAHPELQNLQQAMWMVLRDNGVFAGGALEDMAAQKTNRDIIYGIRAGGQLSYQEMLFKDKLVEYFTASGIDEEKSALMASALIRYYKGGLNLLVGYGLLTAAEKAAIWNDDITFDYTALAVRLKSEIDGYGARIDKNVFKNPSSTIRVFISKLLPLSEYDRLIKDGHRNYNIAHAIRSFGLKRGISVLDNMEGIIEKLRPVAKFPDSMARELIATYGISARKAAEDLYLKVNDVIFFLEDAGFSHHFAYMYARRENAKNAVYELIPLIESERAKSNGLSCAFMEDFYLKKGYEALKDFIAKGSIVISQLKKMGFTEIEANSLYLRKSNNIVEQIESARDKSGRTLLQQLMDMGLTRGRALNIIRANKIENVLSIAREELSIKDILINTYGFSSASANELLWSLNHKEILAIASEVKRKMDDIIAIRADDGSLVYSESKTLIEFILKYRGMTEDGARDLCHVKAEEKKQTVKDIIALGYSPTIVLKIVMIYDDIAQALSFAKEAKPIIDNLISKYFKCYSGSSVGEIYDLCAGYTIEELRILQERINKKYENEVPFDDITLKDLSDVNSDFIIFDSYAAIQYEDSEEEYVSENTQGIQKGRGSVDEDALLDVCTNGKYPGYLIYDRGGDAVSKTNSYSDLVSAAILKLWGMGCCDVSWAARNSRVALVDTFMPALIFEDEYNWSVGYSDQITNTVYLSKRLIDKLLAEGREDLAIALIAYQWTKLLHEITFGGVKELAEDAAIRIENAIAGPSIDIDNPDTVSALDDYLKSEIVFGGPEFMLGEVERELARSNSPAVVSLSPQKAANWAGVNNFMVSEAAKPVDLADLAGYDALFLKESEYTSEDIKNLRKANSNGVVLSMLDITNGMPLDGASAGAWESWRKAVKIKTGVIVKKGFDGVVIRGLDTAKRGANTADELSRLTAELRAETIKDDYGNVIGQMEYPDRILIAEGAAAIAGRLSGIVNGFCIDGRIAKIITGAGCISWINPAAGLPLTQKALGRELTERQKAELIWKAKMDVSSDPNRRRLDGVRVDMIADIIYDAKIPRKIEDAFSGGIVGEGEKGKIIINHQLDITAKLTGAAPGIVIHECSNEDIFKAGGVQIAYAVSEIITDKISGAEVLHIYVSPNHPNIAEAVLHEYFERVVLAENPAAHILACLLELIAAPSGLPVSRRVMAQIVHANSDELLELIENTDDIKADIADNPDLASVEITAMQNYADAVREMAKQQLSSEIAFEIVPDEQADLFAKTVTEQDAGIYQLYIDVKAALEAAIQLVQSELGIILPSDLHLIIFGSRSDERNHDNSDLNLGIVSGCALSKIEKERLRSKIKVQLARNDRYKNIQINFTSLFDNYTSVINLMRDWENGKLFAVIDPEFVTPQRYIIDVTRNEIPIRYRIGTPGTGYEEALENIWKLLNRSRGADASADAALYRNDCTQGGINYIIAETLTRALRNAVNARNTAAISVIEKLMERINVREMERISGRMFTSLENTADFRKRSSLTGFTSLNGVHRPNVFGAKQEISTSAIMKSISSSDYDAAKGLIAKRVLDAFMQYKALEDYDGYINSDEVKSAERVILACKAADQKSLTAEKFNIVVTDGCGHIGTNVAAKIISYVEAPAAAEEGSFIRNLMNENGYTYNPARSLKDQIRITIIDDLSRGIIENLPLDEINDGARYISYKCVDAAKLTELSALGYIFDGVVFHPIDTSDIKSSMNMALLASCCSGKLSVVSDKNIAFEEEYSLKLFAVERGLNYSVLKDIDIMDSGMPADVFMSREARDSEIITEFGLDSLDAAAREVIMQVITDMDVYLFNLRQLGNEAAKPAPNAEYYRGVAAEASAAQTKLSNSLRQFNSWDKDKFAKAVDVIVKLKERAGERAEDIERIIDENIHILEPSFEEELNLAIDDFFGRGDEAGVEEPEDFVYHAENGQREITLRDCLDIIENADVGTSELSTAVECLEVLAEDNYCLTGLAMQFDAGVTFVSQAVINKIKDEFIAVQISKN